jgi:uncharacterized protein (DUF697 family)
MPRLTQLATLWRIVKEVDLEAIRRHAEAPTRVLVVGETATDADDLAALLIGPHPEAATWVTAIDAGTAADDTAAPAERVVVDGPDLVILVGRGPDWSPAMRAARQSWLDRRARLLQVVLQAGPQHGSTQAQGQTVSLALDGLAEDGLDHLARALFTVVEPDLRLSLARQFPPLRSCAFNALIDETAKANAGYAFSTGLAEVVPVLGVPLTIGDILVLTKNQLMMSYRIALAAGKPGKATELIGEIVGVLGGGLLFRQIARQLAGMLPVVGIVPKVAVAYGGTWAIGRAVTVWATEGRKLTGERLRQLSREGLARGRQVANSLHGSDRKKEYWL